jgi:enolase
MKITSIRARQILDSRGNPTVEAEVTLENGIMGRAIVPSGASTGAHEALELRDGDFKVFNGLGVLKAVNNVNTIIADSIKGFEVFDQKAIDEKMIEIDGTKNKSRLGANAILAVSLAVAHAGALVSNKPLYAYFASLAGKLDEKYILPLPMMNIINGGKHGAWGADIQEFIIFPIGAERFHKALEMGVEIFHALAKVLKQNGYSTMVGDEGGYAPVLKKGNPEAFELIIQAITLAGYLPGKDVVFGIDAAASEFYDNGKYYLRSENKVLTSDEMVDYLINLVNQFPIISLEDCLDQEDWSGWNKLTAVLGAKVQIVGDDLLVTNSEFLKRGIKEKSANAILIKVNQIGTLTETINAVQMAQSNDWNAIISHRSGETEDTTIADLSVGLSTGQIKTGSLSRSDRVAKYNQLLRIEEQLGEKAIYLGGTTFGKQLQGK